MTNNHRRLTLRVLLSYLDDTLDPTEIKDIGERIQESAPAQAIIARVKKLVRRRRLTTPPFTGPGAKFDANSIAEYLDNVSDSVSELEEFCLEQDPTADLYLAEIASCHQILTLVEGEPVMVPATAKQRMYGLVQGREAIPFRKPPTRTDTPRLPGSHADMDLDEGSALLGLTPRKSPWLVWAVPAIAALLLVGAGLALYFALPQLTDEPGRHQAANSTGGPKDQTQPVGKDGAPVKDKDLSTRDKDLPRDKDAAIRDKDAPAKDKDTPAKDKDAPTKDGMKEPMTKDPQPMVKDPQPMVKDPQPSALERPGEPSPAKGEIAVYQLGRDPSILVAKQGATWQRFGPDARISSGEPIVALPGYACSVRTNSKVNLLLRGYVPWYVPQETPDVFKSNLHRLLDCAITLHHNSTVDADLTLHRGRLYVSNGDKPATVIVRFWQQAWVLRLTDPNTEVGFDLTTRFLPQPQDEDPLVVVDMVLLKGKIDFLVDTFEMSNLAAQPAISYSWNNKGPRMKAPIPLPIVPPFWSKAIPDSRSARDVTVAAKELDGLPVWRKSVNEILKADGLKSNSREQRILSIYALGAIDEIGQLLDVLGDPDPAHQVEREEASYTIRLWTSRGTQYNRELFNPKAGTGVLIDKGYSPSDATILWTLLHGLTPPNAFQQPDDPKSTVSLLLAYMASDRVAIRQVAHHLLETVTAAVPNRPQLPMFNAAEKVEARDGAIKRFRELLDAGSLTPQPARPAPKP